MKGDILLINIVIPVISMIIIILALAGTEIQYKIDKKKVKQGKMTKKEWIFKWHRSGSYYRRLKDE